MIININNIKAMLNKKKMSRRLDFLKTEGEMVRRTLDEQAVSKQPIVETTDVLTTEEIAELLQSMSPSGFAYRVELDGALAMYRTINLSNYRELVDKIGHMERESEFLRTLCLIDKCEEFADYEYMSRAFKIFEYVIRHNKTNTPVVSYARRWTIEMRRYLEELNLL